MYGGMVYLPLIIRSHIPGSLPFKFLIISDAPGMRKNYICQFIACCHILTYYQFCYSYGVVVWELLSGEIPYQGLEGVAIAFGIGTFTLSLPIPEDCPVTFKELLTGK